MTTKMIATALSTTFLFIGALRTAEADSWERRQFESRPSQMLNTRQAINHQDAAIEPRHIRKMTNP